MVVVDDIKVEFVVEFSLVVKEVRSSVEDVVNRGELKGEELMVVVEDFVV